MPPQSFQAVAPLRMASFARICSNIACCTLGKAIMIEDASKHAAACIEMLEAGKLAEALAYCAAQRVDPPQCSLTAESPNAHLLRVKAMEHLSDEAWWRKRLTILARRDAEMERMKQQRQG
jgi:hypothetical protein